jgi:hypothetical protein
LNAATAVLVLAFAGNACKRQGRPLVLPSDEQIPLAAAVEMADPRHSVQLLRGFYDPQDNWRWTARQFAAALRVPEGAAQSGAVLTLSYAVPDPVIQKLGPLQLSAAAGGVSLPAERIETSGQKEYRQPVPASVLAHPALTVEFALDKALPPDGLETRELGLIAKSLRLELAAPPAKQP